MDDMLAMSSDIAIAKEAARLAKEEDQDRGILLQLVAEREVLQTAIAEFSRIDLEDEECNDLDDGRDSDSSSDDLDLDLDLDADFDF